MAIAPAAKGGALQSPLAAKASKAASKPAAKPAAKPAVKVLATPKTTTPTVSSSDSQFGPDTPWAKAAAQAAADRIAAQASFNAEPEVTTQFNLSSPDPVVVRKINEDAGYIAPTQTANTPAPWTLEGDALYQSALAAGKSAFTFAQAQALADKQNQETAANQQRKNLDTNATESRRRLAGNYAARGMAGGAAGALSMAEARANAEQVAARTSITDQLTALNNQYLANYGDASVKDPITGKSTYDWTGTLAGQQYKTQAAQAAVQAQLARYGAA